MLATDRLFAGLCLTLLSVLAQAQDVRTVMFAETDVARAAATAADAATLSPRLYERGQQAYADAERDLELNRNLERIRGGIAEAGVHFRAAEEVAVRAAESLSSLIKLRNDAAGVDASLHDTENWRQAERRFSEAVIEFERGDEKLAARRATDAEALYRAAELSAIKAAYLSDARRLLSVAGRARAERYAPRTFQLATQLLTDAERELGQDRYDTDRPRELARQAQYEARHAVYLANIVEQARRDKSEPEELILAGEIPLQQIANAADLSVSFDEGYTSATARIIAHIKQSQSQTRELEQKLFERVSQVETLQNQLASLEQRFGGIADERKTLEAQLAQQERERERFRRLESMFHDDQAQVLREGKEVLIRLVGTSFPVGKATIEPEVFGLLTRVMDAVRLYPDAKIRIEGHTDSFGGDAFNMDLSRKRANAVRMYLLANMSIDEQRLESSGYGETRPIANNETRDGRARNRRIDLVIRPPS